jgi:UDPglucose--hexose-1-phosphate uridylyltransferase
MPELRRDPIVDRYVIVAENRAARPGAFFSSGAAPSSDAASSSRECPFCAGCEDETPSEVFALRDDCSSPDRPGWRVRVVPNKYPALDGEGAAPADRGTDIHRSPSQIRSSPDIPRLPLNDLFHSQRAIGLHEVIIATPRHVTAIAELSGAEFVDLLSTYRVRLEALRRDNSLLKHVLIFQNVGRLAGASIEHLHSQLVATDFVPPAVADELRGAQKFFDQHHQCVFCRMVEQEISHGKRIVAESPAFVALCPYASRFAFETWILPKRHAGDFDSISPADLDGLANLAHGAIAKIERLSQPPAYNLILHTSPFDSLPIEHYHWHIEVIPRLTLAAGFEWSSGCFINPVSPESAAATLRADADW